MGIFSMFVRLGLDSAAFESGVKRSQSAIVGLGRSALSGVKGQLAAAFSVGAVTAFAHSVVEAADRIGDLSDQMGLSVEDVQKLDIAAKRSGLEVERIGQAFLKVGEYRKKAGEGDAEAAETLERMGVSMADIQNRSMSNRDMTEKIYNWYLKTNRTAKDQADIAEVVGLKAEKLVAAFKELHQLGPVKLMSEDDIAAISKFKDASEDLKRNLQVAAAPAVGWWAGVLQKRNEYERNPETKWYHGSMLAAIIDGFQGDPDGTKTAAPTKEEVETASAALKASRAAEKDPLFDTKLDHVAAKGFGKSYGMGDLNSIGGLMFNQFDRGDVLRSVKEATARTAENTREIKDSLKKATAQ